MVAPYFTLSRTCRKLSLFNPNGGKVCKQWSSLTFTALATFRKWPSLKSDGLWVWRIWYSLTLHCLREWRQWWGLTFGCVYMRGGFRGPTELIICKAWNLADKYDSNPTLVHQCIEKLTNSNAIVRKDAHKNKKMHNSTLEATHLGECQISTQTKAL